MNKGVSRGAFRGSADSERDAPIDWELRPGGMLVQRRDPDPALGPIKGKSSLGLFSHDHVTATKQKQPAFGDLQKFLAREPSVKLKGKQKEVEHSDRPRTTGIAGFRDRFQTKTTPTPTPTPTIPAEDPATREKRIEDMRKRQQVARACKAIAAVRSEVDHLARRVSELEGNILISGAQGMESEFGALTESLMRLLLKLDSVEAHGEAKALRRTEVHRVQTMVERLDGLKARHPQSGAAEDPSVTKAAHWETFDNGMGSLTAPTPSAWMPNFMDWERFD